MEDLDLDLDSVVKDSDLDLEAKDLDLDLNFEDLTTNLVGRYVRELTIASSPMPLPMFRSNGTIANLPASPDTFMMKRIP